MINLEKTTRPTMYFIGVSTGKSTIMKVFPDWMKAMGIDATICGIDMPIHSPQEMYRQVVDFIKKDKLSLGALVTTHKLDIFSAANDMFEYIDPYAQMFHEMSSISKDNGKLCCHAKDPITCGMAMEEFIPANYWANNPDTAVFIMGAGGSAISMCSYFMRKKFAGNYPSQIVVANRSKPRLDELAAICSMLKPDYIQCEFHLTPEAGQNDEVLKNIPGGSLVINATGLGKDRSGSPLTDAAVFPMNSFVWEINYRGELDFMHQAEQQQAKQNLKVEDGWMYFIYGWTQVMADVFHTPIEGKLLDELSSIAAKYNNR